MQVQVHKCTQVSDDAIAGAIILSSTFSSASEVQVDTLSQINLKVIKPKLNTLLEEEEKYDG